MRAKVVLGAAVLAGAILASAFYFHNRQNNAPTANTADATAVAEPAQLPDSHPQAPSRKTYAFHRDDLAIPNEGENPGASAEAHRQYVTSQESILAELGSHTDAGSLAAVEAQLNNRDPAIRKAAVNAAVQIGSPDAIPALQNEMLYIDDPLEKAELQNAINFLQLPSVDTAIPEQSSDTPPPN